LYSVTFLFRDLCTYSNPYSSINAGTAHTASEQWVVQDSWRCSEGGDSLQDLWKRNCYGPHQGPVLGVGHMSLQLGNSSWSACLFTVGHTSLIVSWSTIWVPS